MKKLGQFLIATPLCLDMRKILCIIALLILTGVSWYFSRSSRVEYRQDIAELGEDPLWEELHSSQTALKSDDFVETVSKYYVVGDTWQKYFSIDQAGSEIRMKTQQRDFIYEMKPTQEVPKRGSRYWRGKGELPERDSKVPLQGVRIALDPGHIGGKCAKMEERWFQIDEGIPVMEGEMTLLVAQLIKPKLEALGADVFLTREANRPITRKRSPHFKALAKAKVEALALEESLTDRFADKLFYRTAEIRARARKVNESIQPDLVVALHFNAEAWGDPADPQLTDNNHFHILLNGAYTTSELAQEDQRFEMTRRVLQGTIQEEVALSQSFVEAFKAETELPPYQYERNSTRAIQVDEEGYVWTRNLLANRLYQCPTIFLEPYIMNSHEVHTRIQLGDYHGLKEVAGKMRKSIYREYADAVVTALKAYYTMTL